MRMHRHFGDRERFRCAASHLTDVVRGESGSLAMGDSHRALQVGQSEGHPAIAAVKSPEQREQRGVLRDWQELAVAERPASWGEGETENADLRNERVRHGCLSVIPVTGISRTTKLCS